MVPENAGDVAIQRNITLLQQELSTPKPHLESVISLMEHTFTHRKEWILENVESVVNIILSFQKLFM